MADSKIADAVALHFVPSDGAPWAEFLKTKLSEKTYGLDVRLFDATDISSVQEKCSVNILLFSPDFLDVDSLEHFSSYSSKSSLAVLLGVEESDYREALTEKNGKHLHYWSIFETQANEDSVRFLLVDIIDVYEHAQSLEDVNSDESQGSVVQSPPDADYDKLPSPRPVPSFHEDYGEPNRVYKIINLGGSEHQEILVLLNRKEKCVVTVETEDPKDTNIKCESLDKAVYRCKITGDPGKITVKTGENIIGSGQIGINANQGQLQRKDSKENISKKNKLDNLRDILEDEIDPVCLLCNAMSLENHSIPALDKELADRFARYRSLEELGKLFRKREPDGNEPSEKGKWPSLLHFAADFDLKKFCDELLRFPGMVRQVNIKNEDGQTPGTLAEKQGHIELSNKLKRISRKVDSGIGDEFAKHHSIIEISSQDPDEDEDDLYKVPPPKPHVVPKTNYANQSGITQKNLPKQSSTEIPIPEPDEDYVLPEVFNRDEIEKRNSAETNTLSSSQNETDFAVKMETRDSDEDDVYMVPNPTPCTKHVNSPPPKRDVSVTDTHNEYMAMNNVKRPDAGDHVDTQENVKPVFLDRHQCHSESEIKSVERDSDYTTLETFDLLHNDDRDSLFYTDCPHDIENVSPPCACGHGLTKTPKRQRSGSIDSSTKPIISKPKGFFGKMSAKLNIGKHRKNSLPADLAYEEKMARFRESPKSDNRVSDISTTSSASTNSNTSIHDAIADLSLHGEPVKEESEETIKHRKSYKHKSKNPFGHKKKLEPHRKSIRIANVLQDTNLTILELPKKKK